MRICLSTFRRGEGHFGILGEDDEEEKSGEKGGLFDLVQWWEMVVRNGL